jgi:hypothetical protein
VAVKVSSSSQELIEKRQDRCPADWMKTETSVEMKNLKKKDKNGIEQTWQQL